MSCLVYSLAEALEPSTSIRRLKALLGAKTSSSTSSDVLKVSSPGS